MTTKQRKHAASSRKPKQKKFSADRCLVMELILSILIILFINSVLFKKQQQQRCKGKLNPITLNSTKTARTRWQHYRYYSHTSRWQQIIRPTSCYRL